MKYTLALKDLPFEPLRNQIIYLPRLVRAGLRVAICDALEAPAPAKRGRKPKASKAQPTNEELFTNA